MENLRKMQNMWCCRNCNEKAEEMHSMARPCACSCADLDGGNIESGKEVWFGDGRISELRAPALGGTSHSIQKGLAQDPCCCDLLPHSFPPEGGAIPREGVHTDAQRI
jgi:hypothetical protein